MANSAGPRGNQEANPERKKVFGGQRGAEKEREKQGEESEGEKRGGEDERGAGKRPSKW